MGALYYGASPSPILIEDGALAHLKIVITTKLRRGESFTLSWPHGDGEPLGRSTIWLHPAVPLRFTFDDVEQPELDPQRLSDMAHVAYSMGGIRLATDDMDPVAAS